LSNISNLEDYRAPTPNTENSKVTNTRKYKDVREREYLTSSEIDRISKAAKSIGRHGHRDSTIIMTAHHHDSTIMHYMCHKNIQHTVWYTELCAGRLDNFWN